jgi:pimeloyl-ACP methyl ester carboxylesterase
VQGDNPPGLILAHRLGSDRHEWDTFAGRAQSQGYFCIAFDARGHGQSLAADGRAVSHRDFRDTQWLAMVDDFAAAKEELIRRGVDPENIAVLGAELGGSAALYYSRSDPDIRSVVLLSPGRKYKVFDTEATIRDLRGTPILLIATEDDSYSLSSSISLKEAAQGYCELRTYAGSRLGVDILAFSENATAQVFRWLSKTLDRSNRALLIP